MPTRDLVTAQGNVLTEADAVFAMSNWAAITALSAATVPAPSNQTGPTTTLVAALGMMPVQSGLFFVTAKASYSDGTTAGALTMRLITKQGAGNGQVGGGVAAAKIGQGAAGAGAFGTTFVGTNGQILNADAAGGGGLTFEGGAVLATGVTQSEDKQATLTGLLNANGQGVQNFEFTGIVDAAGPTLLAKTPFTLNTPALIAIQVTDTAAHVVTFDSLTLQAFEWPVR